MAKMTNDSNVSRIWNRMKTYVGNKLADKMNKDGSNADNVVSMPSDKLEVISDEIDDAWEEAEVGLTLDNDIEFDSTAVTFSRYTTYQTGVNSLSVIPYVTDTENQTRHFGFKFPLTVGATAWARGTQYAGKILAGFYNKKNPEILINRLTLNQNTLKVSNIKKSNNNVYTASVPKVYDSDFIYDGNVIAKDIDESTNKIYFVCFDSSNPQQTQQLYTCDLIKNTLTTSTLPWPSDIYYSSSYPIYSILKVCNNVLYFYLRYYTSNSSSARVVKLYKANLSSITSWTQITLPTLPDSYTVYEIQGIVYHHDLTWICFRTSFINKIAHDYLYSFNGQSAWTLRYDYSVNSSYASYFRIPFFVKPISCYDRIYWVFAYDRTSYYAAGAVGMFDDSNDSFAYENILTNYSHNQQLTQPGEMFKYNDELYFDALNQTQASIRGLYKAIVDPNTNTIKQRTKLTANNYPSNYSDYPNNNYCLYKSYNKNEPLKKINDSCIKFIDYINNEILLGYLNSSEKEQIDNTDIYYLKDVKLSDMSYMAAVDNMSGSAQPQDKLEARTLIIHNNSLSGDKFYKVYAINIDLDDNIWLYYIDFDFRIMSKIAIAANATISGVSGKYAYQMLIGYDPSKDFPEITCAEFKILVKNKLKNNPAVISPLSTDSTSKTKVLGSRSNQPNGSIVIGSGNVAKSENQIILGNNANPNSSDVLAIGNGDHTNLLTISPLGNIITNGCMPWAQGRLKGVLLQNSPYWYDLEDGACYILSFTSRTISNNAFRGIHCYLISNSWASNDTGAQTTAGGVGRATYVTLGSAGTVGQTWSLDALPYIYTNPGTGTTYQRYHTRLGIGSTATSIDVRFSLVKVMGSVEDFS